MRPLPGPRAWSSQHGDDGIRRLADEAVLITGDGNLLEVQATIRYSIAEPRTFLFEVNEPTSVLRSAAESVLREVAASHTFNELLSGGRDKFHTEALERLQQRCLYYGPSGLGLRIEGLALHDLHPPQEVVDALPPVVHHQGDGGAHDRRGEHGPGQRPGPASGLQQGESVHGAARRRRPRLEKGAAGHGDGRDAFLARRHARSALEHRPGRSRCCSMPSVAAGRRRTLSRTTERAAGRGNRPARGQQ